MSSDICGIPLGVFITVSVADDNLSNVVCVEEQKNINLHVFSATCHSFHCSGP